MRKILLSFLLLCSLVFNTPAFAAIWGGGGEKGIVKTGQTTSYADYDDGYYQKGLARSYTDNGDGTITDNVTGLQWIKQPELIIPGASVITGNQVQVAKGDWATSTEYAIGDLVSRDGTDSAPYFVCSIAHTSGTFADDLAAGKWRETVWTASAAGLTSPATMTWANSITNCEGLVYAGHSDWRLPNINELQSIADYSAVSPAINGTYFPNTQSGYYWSGTTFADSTDYAWVVYVYTGSVDVGIKGFECYVRPVRSSQ